MEGLGSFSSAENIEAQLKQYGNYASVTVGVSMRPLFKEKRDAVMIEATSSPLKKYDVALYKTGDKYILHRVIKADEEKQFYIIRGDNTWRREYVPYSAVLGKLVSFNRGGKHVEISNGKYKAYSVIWTAIYPIRYVLHLPFAVLRKIYRRLKPRG